MVVAGPTSVTLLLDEMAVYTSKALTAARVLAHYTAGSARGYDQQLPGNRVSSVLDSVASHAPRSIQAGTRTMWSSFMQNAPPLDLIRQAVRCEAPDGMFFAGRGGTLTFLSNDDHASRSVDATFDDDGTDLPYLDLDLGYSDAFITNIWNVIKLKGKATQTASDATSISRYDERPQTITDLPVTTNANALTIAQAYLAKYKDPLTRILSIQLDSLDPNLADEMFRRELGDKIRILRTPPGGGTRIDQSAWIQKITVEVAGGGAPWQVVYGVSPV
jgi:hypothetical protein